MASTFTTFNTFSKDLLLGNHVIGTSTYKVLLTNTQPLATNAVKSDITEISAANGYTAGGASVTLTKSSTGTTTTVLSTDPTWTATGAVASFAWAVLYNSANNCLVGYLSVGASPITLANTDTFTVQFDAVNGIAKIG